MKRYNNEYSRPQDEYGTLPEEFVKPDADEFASAFSAVEFSGRADEFTPAGCEEYSGNEGSPSGKSSGAGHSAKLRNMAYMIASAAAVVMVAAAAIPNIIKVAEPVKEIVYEDRFIDISEYSVAGAAGGGVITLEKTKGDKKFVLVDYNMKILFESDASQTLLSHPTQDGYTLAKDSKGVFILDNKGKERSRIAMKDIVDEDVGDMLQFAGISDGVVFMMVDQGDYTPRRYLYYDIDGRLIYKSKPQKEYNEQADDEQFMGATYFNGGYAYLTEDDMLKKIDKKGNVKVIADWSADDLANSEKTLADTKIEILMNYSGDWLLGQLPHGDYDWLLVNVKTGEAHSCYCDMNGVMPSADGKGHSGGVLGIHYHSPYEDMYEDARFYIPYNAYYKDGAMHYNIGSYVARKYIGSGYFYQTALTDYKNEDRYTENSGAFAWYDEIYASCDGTFLIFEDGQYFFVNTANKILSGKYYKASTFTPDGYAVVIDKKGSEARVIDTDHKTVSTLKGVDDLDPESHGQALIVYSKGKMQVVIPQISEDGKVKNAAEKSSESSKPSSTAKPSGTAKPSSTVSPSSTDKPGSVVNDILSYHDTHMGNYAEDPGMISVSVFYDTGFSMDAHYNGYGMANEVSIDIPDPPAMDGFEFLGYVVYCDYDEDGNVTRICPLKDGNFDFWEFKHLKPGDRGDDVEVHASWRYKSDDDSDGRLIMNANGGDFGSEHDNKTELRFTTGTPLASLGKVYLCTYPEPVREGYEFAGWYREGSEDEVFFLPAVSFIKWYIGDDGEEVPDWNTPNYVTLYAKWVKK